MRAFLFIDFKKTAPTHESSFIESHSPDFFVLKNEQGNVYLRKRTAYPGTFCKKIDTDNFVLGYGDITKQPDREFLEVKLSSKNIIIQRDRFATLPIFYGLVPGRLIISNEYEAVVHALPNATLSRPGLLERLVDTHYPARWYAHEVGFLREGECLQYYEGKVHITYPSGRAWLRSRDLPYTDPRSFRKKLDEYFEYFIATRLEGQAFAFEVSGGLDSVTLPQYYARTHGGRVPHATLIYPEQFAITQCEKLAAVQDISNGVPIQIKLNPAIHFPLADMIIRQINAPRLVETIYAEAFDSLLRRLPQNVNVIITGIGGDELFGNVASPEKMLGYGDSEKQERTHKVLPGFLTKKFKDEYVATAPTAPFSALPSRSLSVTTTLCGNNIYLRRDIWPVSPFVDPGLYAWCQGLPVHFRANRNILRAYHQAYGFAPEIYNRLQNEHFGEFFLSCVRSGVYDELVQRLLSNSITVRLGYVNAETLLDTYHDIKSSQGYAETYGDNCYTWFLWLLAEINAQYSGFQAVS